MVDIDGRTIKCDGCGRKDDLWMVGSITTKRVRDVMRTRGWCYRRLYITPPEYHGSAREWVMVDLCPECAAEEQPE